MTTSLLEKSITQNGSQAEADVLPTSGFSIGHRTRDFLAVQLEDWPARTPDLADLLVSDHKAVGVDIGGEHAS